jgi:hypothetical protein
VVPVIGPFRDHFVVPVSGPLCGTGFYFFGRASCGDRMLPRSCPLPHAQLGDCFGFLDCFDLAPVMRWRLSAAVAAICERQQEMIRLPVFGIAASTAHQTTGGRIVNQERSRQIFRLGLIEPMQQRVVELVRLARHKDDSSSSK